MNLPAIRIYGETITGLRVTDNPECPRKGTIGKVRRAAARWLAEHERDITTTPIGPGVIVRPHTPEEAAARAARLAARAPRTSLRGRVLEMPTYAFVRRPATARRPVFEAAL